MEAYDGPDSYLPGMVSECEIKIMWQHLRE